MPLSPILPAILVLLVHAVAAFEPCDGIFCPPLVSRPKITAIEASGPAPIFLGRDTKSGCLCREYPNVFVVCFGRLLCQRMPTELNITAPLLKLTGTHIVELRPGDFDSLFKLEALQLDGNYNLTTILPGTFNQNMIKLTNLSISFNPVLKTLHPRSFEGLVNLKTLYMIKNAFENVYDVTQALSAQILPNLFKLSLNENSFNDISKDDFSPMENSSLKELDLVLCRLEQMASDCFVPLSNLEALRLGENSFNVSTITKVISKTVELGVPLRLLNLYSLGFRKNPPKELLEVIAKSNISNLNLAHNQFEVISSDAFPYMPNLQVLDLRRVLTLEVNPEAFYKLPNLKTLLLSGNKLQSVPENAIPGNLTYLDLQQNSGNLFYPSYFCIKDRKFRNLTHLAYLNLNFNRLNLLYNTSFIGLDNLRVLGLKNGTIYHIHNDSFLPLKNLWFLDLQNNYFITNNYPLGIELDTFKGLENLKVLLLGGCDITYFSKYGNPFVYLKNLEHLGLERNKISTIAPTDLAPLARLASIDVSENKLLAWQDRIFSKNLNLKTVVLNRNRFGLLSEAMLDDFSNVTQVELEINPFSCDCEGFYHFDEWFHHRPRNVAISSSKIKAHCAFPEPVHNYSLVEYFRSVHNGTIVCGPWRISKLVVVLPLVLLFLIFIILAVTMYYYRWHIRYWVFLTRLYLSRKGKIKASPEKKGYNNYVYDAFVSYSNEDRNFVVRLVSMLENYEPFLKLCVYDRDFQIGAMITESVLESVAKSRRTLLIISDNYAKSQWCRWESQIAEHHRLFFEDQNGEYVDDTLVLIKLGPVSANHLTPTLRYLLKTRIYLQWEVDEKKQKVFWGKLRNALAPPKLEQVVLENTRM